MLPRKFRDVNKSIDSTKVYKCTEVYDRGNDSGTNLSLKKLIQECGPRFGLSLL